MNELLREIGLEAEDEEMTASPPAAGAQGAQRDFPTATSNDEDVHLQENSAGSGGSVLLPQLGISPHCESENTIQPRAVMEQDTNLQQDVVAQPQRTSEQETTEHEIVAREIFPTNEPGTVEEIATLGRNETMYSAPASFSADQKLEKTEGIIESSQRSQPEGGARTPGDGCQQQTHSVPEKGSCEHEADDKKSYEGSLKNVKTEPKEEAAPSSQDRNEHSGSNSDRPQTSSAQSSWTLLETGFPETRCVIGTTTVPQPPPLIPTTSSSQADNESSIPEAGQGQFHSWSQSNLGIGARRNGLHRSSLLLPVPSNSSVEQLRSTPPNYENSTSGTQLQAQNTSHAGNTQGIALSYLPPSNEVSRFLPTSPMGEINLREDQEIVQPAETGTYSVLWPPPPLPPIPQNPLSTHSLQEVPRGDENAEINSPPRVGIERLQTPDISIYSTSPRLSKAESVKSEEEGEKTSEVRTDACKPRERKTKDSDDEDSDLEKDSTERTLRTAIGVSRKVSPSAEDGQAYKRPSVGGQTLEEGEILEDLGESVPREKQETESEKPSEPHVTDEKDLQELTPSKTPDRPRLFLSPPGMPLVSRLELPENFPEEPSPLGNGRRYQRKNMPPEYIPPRFNETHDAQDDSSSGEEDSCTDDSEDEESYEAENEAQDEGSSDGEIVQRVSVAKIESRNKPKSRRTITLHPSTSGSQRQAYTRSTASIPPRRSSQTLPIRTRNKYSGNRSSGFDSPEIEAWTEPPRLPRPRSYRNHQIIHANHQLIYLVSPPSSRSGVPPQEFSRRITGAIGNESTFEFRRVSDVARRTIRSDRPIIPRASRLYGTRNPGETELPGDRTNFPTMTRLPATRNLTARSHFMGRSRNSSA